jgi:transposase
LWSRRRGRGIETANHQGIRRAVRTHLLFLPPYRPDLNPIEQAFAKLKHLL